MKKEQIQDRAAGALMGAFIGDGLGLGPHWYYDLKEQYRDYGEWIDDYVDPKPDRYHGGMKAGQLSQAGVILELTARSLTARGGYDQEDFCRRLDEDLFPHLNGEPAHGPGGYTSQSIREAWRRRVEQNLPWGETAGHADTTEALERTLAIGIRYALDPAAMAEAVSANTVLTQSDDVVASMTVAYCAALGLVVKGSRFNRVISGKLMKLVKDGVLPFHAVTRDNLKPPRPGDPDPPRAGRFASPDALLSPGYMAGAAEDPDIRIEPAWKVSQVYGMPCAIYHILPASYYLAARFGDDFESAVLHAINGGGQNLARAMLTGTLVGAQVGLSGIPARFVDGLEKGEELKALAVRLAEQATENAD